MQGKARQRRRTGPHRDTDDLLGVRGGDDSPLQADARQASTVPSLFPETADGDASVLERGDYAGLSRGLLLNRKGEPVFRTAALDSAQSALVTLRRWQVRSGLFRLGAMANVAAVVDAVELNLRHSLVSPR